MTATTANPYTVVPIYPDLARRERLEGDVQVCFNVDRSGIPHRVRVRRSTNRIFEKPSLLAVRASTYQPLPEGRKPSGIKTCRTFRFRLNPVAIERPQ
jgi:TonB family protein